MHGWPTDILQWGPRVGWQELESLHGLQKFLRGNWAGGVSPVQASSVSKAFSLWSCETGCDQTWIWHTALDIMDSLLPTDPPSGIVGIKNRGRLKVAKSVFFFCRSCCISFGKSILSLPLFPSITIWKWNSLSCVQLFAAPWTMRSVEFSRPEYWSG